MVYQTTFYIDTQNYVRDHVIISNHVVGNGDEIFL